MISVTIDCAKRFIARVTEGTPPSNEELMRLIDELAQAYHACPEGDVTDSEVDIPRRESLCQEIATRFPDLGLYSIADSSSSTPQEPGVGDAIDDLADIVRDLQDVIDHYETLGADDAHWLFRFLFRLHWGEHLRQLALYLHVKEFHT